MPSAENGDQTSALEELKLLAKNGNADAQCQLGQMYIDGGNGVLEVLDDYREAYKEAFYWFRLAAEQGHADGQYCIGEFYNSGEGEVVSEDKKEAFYWFQLAAEQGHELAQNYLRFMYSEGEGVKKDLIYAYKWGKVLSIWGDDESTKFICELSEKMTSSQIKEAQSLAGEYVKKNNKVLSTHGVIVRNIF